MKSQHITLVYYNRRSTSSADSIEYVSILYNENDLSYGVDEEVLAM